MKLQKIAVATVLACLLFAPPANAGRAGGGMRSGSFSRPSTSRPATSAPRSAPRSTTTTPNSSTRRTYSNNTGGGTTIVPIYIDGNNGYSNTPVVPLSPAQQAAKEARESAMLEVLAGFIIWSVIVGVSAVSSVFMIRLLLEYIRNRPGEYIDDKLTVVKLDVAVLQNTPGLQSFVSKLIRTTDTSSLSSTVYSMHELAAEFTAKKEYLTHGNVFAKTLHAEKAEALFDQLDLADRAKRDQTCVTNRDGAATDYGYDANIGAAPGRYHVINFLVALEDNSSPLPKTIGNIDDLISALSVLATMPLYRIRVLSVNFAAIEGEALTEEEFLQYYGDMRAV